MPVIVTLTESTVSAATLIKRAMRLLGQLGAGESPTTDETADGLETLNALLDSFRNERLMAYAMREESLTLSVGVASYTIGSSGDLNTNRPVSIERAVSYYQSLTTPVQVINEQEWASIPSRTTTGDVPTHCYYAPTLPLGTLYVYPVPSAAGVLRIVTRVPHLAFAASTDTTTLAPGWNDALASNLALRWAPEFETRPSPELIEFARTSKAAIKQLNAREIKATTGLDRLVGVSTTNILNGP